MLPASLRMHRSEDFALTIRGGARSGRDTLVVHVREVPERVERRVGFVVAKTVGGAVVRNRVRRRLRGVVVEQIESLPHGADVVVRALPTAADASYADLAKDYRGALGAAVRRARERAARVPGAGSS